MEIDEKIEKKLNELMSKGDPRINIHKWSTFTLDRKIESMRRNANGKLSLGIYPDIEFLAIRGYMVEERARRIPKKYIIWCQNKIAQAVLEAKGKIAIQEEKEKLQKKKKATS